MKDNQLSGELVYTARMDASLTQRVLDATSAHEITRSTLVQRLWSGYGAIVRLELSGGDYSSIILKHIKLPEAGSHPRGWNTDRSHQRKVRSYQVEAHWYQHYTALCDASCTVPDCLTVESHAGETLLLLTDLDSAGFDLRKERVDAADIDACLAWLANFHAVFMDSAAPGLWERGTYWHLETRPDELEAMDDPALRHAAPMIDRELREAHYQTILHGDAKLANFCFSGNTDAPGVAAVDFQYVGPGCGIQDVAYFIGSCLDEDDCAALEQPLLDHYFNALKSALATRQPDIDGDAIEREWRSLYDIAWADFHRFLKGWSPGHWKLNSYSERLTRAVIARLSA